MNRAEIKESKLIDLAAKAGLHAEDIEQEIMHLSVAFVIADMEATGKKEIRWKCTYKDQMVEVHYVLKPRLQVVNHLNSPTVKKPWWHLI